MLPPLLVIYLESWCHERDLKAIVQLRSQLETAVALGLSVVCKACVFQMLNYIICIQNIQTLWANFLPFFFVDAHTAPSISPRLCIPWWHACCVLVRSSSSSTTGTSSSRTASRTWRYCQPEPLHPIHFRKSTLKSSTMTVFFRLKYF